MSALNTDPLTWVILAIVVWVVWLLRHEIADTRLIPRHLTRCPHCSQTFVCDDPITEAEVDEILAGIEAL